MARLSIPDVPSYAVFPSATAQAIFPFSFPVFAKADLNVTVNDVPLAQSDFTLSGTLADGGGYQGGTITLNTAATGKVVIARNVITARAAQFAPANTTPVGSIDQALNRDMAILQDVRRDLARALMVGYGETAPGLTDLLTGIAETAIARDEAVAAATILNGVLLDVRSLPEFYGAVSGTVSASVAISNTLALKVAVNTGIKIDGRGRTYDIYGEYRPTLACRLSNITLRQRSTDSAIEKHFLIDGLTASDILLDNVTIDCNGLTQVGEQSQARAIQISSFVGRLVMRDCTVINGKNITAVELVGLVNPVVTGLRVREFYPSFATEPTDDVCQGLLLTNCTNPVVSGFDIENMVASWPGAPTVRRQYSRGLVVGNSTGGLITGGRVRNVEQPIDLTGGAYGFTVSNNLVIDAGTWGIKCANRFNDITVENNTIIRPGFAGIVITAPASVTGVMPSRVTVRNNTIKDPGSSGLWGAGSDALGPRGPAGIKVGGTSTAVAGYPAGIRMFGNTIEDSQTAKTMVWGIDVFVGTPGNDAAFPALPAVMMVEEWGNVITGWSTGGRQRGCQYHRCSLVGTGSFSATNNAWVAVPFTAAPDLDDTAALHDPSTNPSFITVRETGTYAVRGFMPWDNIAVGVRGLRFRVAGGSSYAQVRLPSGYGAAGQGTEMEVSGFFRVLAGQRVELEAFQNSGAVVSQPLTGCTLELAMVQRG